MDGLYCMHRRAPRGNLPFSTTLGLLLGVPLGWAEWKQRVTAHAALESRELRVETPVASPFSLLALGHPKSAQSAAFEVGHGAGRGWRATCPQAVPTLRGQSTSVAQLARRSRRTASRQPHPPHRAGGRNANQQPPDNQAHFPGQRARWSSPSSTFDHRYPTLTAAPPPLPLPLDPPSPSQWLRQHARDAASAPRARPLPPLKSPTVTTLQNGPGKLNGEASHRHPRDGSHVDAHDPMHRDHGRPSPSRTMTIHTPPGVANPLARIGTSSGA